MMMPFQAHFPSGWFAAEAFHDGAPLLIRGRRLPAPIFSFPSLLVLTYKYAVDDSTALPNSDQYERIRTFEARSLDALEAENLGLLVFVETGGGAIHHYCYVSDIRSAVALIDKSKPEELYVDMASDDDHEWKEYHRLMDQVVE